MMAARTAFSLVRFSFSNVAAGAKVRQAVGSASPTRRRASGASTRDALSCASARSPSSYFCKRTAEIAAYLFLSRRPS